MLPVLSCTMKSFADAHEEGLNVCKEVLEGTSGLARSVQKSLFPRRPRLPEVRSAERHLWYERPDDILGSEDRAGEWTQDDERKVTLPPPHMIGTSTTSLLRPTSKFQPGNQRQGAITIETTSKPRRPRGRVATIPQASGRTLVPGMQQQRHRAYVVSHVPEPTSRPNHNLSPFLSKSYQILERRRMSITAGESTTADLGSVDPRVPGTGSAPPQLPWLHENELAEMHSTPSEAYALSGHDSADVVLEDQPGPGRIQLTRPVRLFCDFGETFSHVHSDTGCRCEALSGLTQDDGSLLHSRTAFVGQPGIGYVRCADSLGSML